MIILLKYLRINFFNIASFFIYSKSKNLAMKNLIFLLFITLAVSCNNAESGKSIQNNNDGKYKKTVPSWSKNLTIYEVNLRQYSESGSFKDFEKHLPRLKEMGVGILWIMPINTIGIKNRKGTLGSYYSVKDYLAVNPEFGTMDDFKNLVKKCHEMGFYIILPFQPFPRFCPCT